MYVYSTVIYNIYIYVPEHYVKRRITHSTVVLCISPLKTIYKDFVHFHFQFEVDFTFNDIKVKNV